MQLVGRAHIDGARAEHDIARCAFDSGLVHIFAAELHIGAQTFGLRDIGHLIVVMLKPRLGLLEAGHQIKDWAVAATLFQLAGDDAAVGEAAPVEIGRDIQRGFRTFFAPAQKVRVHGMRFLAIADRCLRGLERLCDHLSAEHPADAILLRFASELHCASGLHCEQLYKAGDHAFGGGCVGHGGSIASR